jgi:hypothetical protein
MHGRKWKFPCMYPDGLKKPTRVPLSKARIPPEIRTGNVQKEINHNDLFGDEQF